MYYVCCQIRNIDDYALIGFIHAYLVRLKLPQHLGPLSAITASHYPHPDRGYTLRSLVYTHKAHHPVVTILITQIKMYWYIAVIQLKGRYFVELWFNITRSDNIQDNHFQMPHTAMNMKCTLLRLHTPIIKLIVCPIFPVYLIKSWTPVPLLF